VRFYWVSFEVPEWMWRCVMHGMMLKVNVGD
jgi:hypothetical protein